MRWALAATLILLAGAAHGDTDSRDYRADSPAWNGLSSFVEEAHTAGCALTTTDHLDWSQLSSRDVLFFVYPQSTIEASALGAFLTNGGRVLIADDYGAASTTLEALEIRRHPARLESVPRDLRHPELPVARAGLLTALGRSTPELLANHPAAFETALPATFVFSAGQALVVEGKVGRGHFVALADPSVLINNMLDVPGNRAFVRALLADLCLPGPDGDRVHLVSGPFLSSGEPRTASSTNAHTLFNELCTTLNRATDEALDAAGLPIALVLVIAATAVGWRAVGRLSGAGHADGRFVRAEGEHRQGTLALVDALPRGDSDADHALALILLRAEVSRRLSASLGAITASTPRAELLRRTGDKLGPTMRTALERFLAVGPRHLDTPGHRAVSRRAFATALAYARPLLARLPISAASYGATSQVMKELPIVVG